MPELKLLVDAIQSSKFITHKKSLSLIKKLEGLVSENEGKQLQRQVYVSNRVKNVNEKIYYNVDTLHNAIAREKQVAFKYCKWETDFNSDKKIVKVESFDKLPSTGVKGVIYLVPHTHGSNDTFDEYIWNTSAAKP